MLDIGGVYNFRDLGGRTTTTGKTIRTGLMFRSATLDQIDADGLRAIESLGIRTVVDLRSDAEVEMHGRFPFEGTTIRWVHIPFPMGAPGRSFQESGTASGSDHAAMAQHNDPMALVFTRLVTDSAPYVGQVVRQVADAQAPPVVFHCTSGKDRTGLVSAIIQLVVGLDIESVLVEFERSGAFRDQIRTDIAARLSHLTDFTPDVLDRMAGVDRRWLVDALARVGGPAGFDAWLDSIAVDVAVRDSLRSLMVD